ncbi:hypothetical protein P782_0470 [Enterococcus faecalis FL2]|uniref:hypothetical protein n=1 Tax=Enterococcus faecalis TaxID=1351 RepID=UPI00045A6164|nr:hypothetical protein [Enterococcus faecalis]KAJ65855.1 hypothetical protein P782_0470 [Enterococcus faecalis FL2]
MDEIQESGVWDSLWMLGLSTAAIRSTQTFSKETGSTGNVLKGSKNGQAYTLDRNKTAEAKFSGEDIFNYTNKVNEHMANPDRAVPAQTLKEVINGGISMSDPRGSSATMYYSEIYINDKKYNFEVLYDKPTNTVYHFKYDRRPLGPLPAVSKQ